MTNQFTKPSEEKGTFNQPEKLPGEEKEAKQWQEANKSFWENNSMRYDWKQSIPYEEFSDEFYKEIDNRFLGAVHEVMPWKKIPFEQWIDFDALEQQDVLEIGVGNGTHAQILSSRAKSYTGIDLTEYAATSSSNRLRLSGLPGHIIQMDAENMTFPAASFDFVWSWGVIHHSSNTGKILREIHRVLRKDGKAVIMVYYRSWWSYYLAGSLLGIFKGYFFNGKTIHQINQLKTDGALARYYTLASWRQFVKDKFDIRRLETLGNKGDIIPLPGSKVKSVMEHLIPLALTKWSLNNFRMGSFLICEMVKK